MLLVFLKLQQLGYQRVIEKNYITYLKNSKKEIHFLGVWYNLGELLNLGNDVWDRLRSADTCLPSLYAIQGKKIIQDRDGTINLERDYKELTEESYDLIMQEIEKEIIKSYIHICY